jgi:hypothetical protein
LNRITRLICACYLGTCSAQIASMSLVKLHRYNEDFARTNNCILGDVGSSAWSNDGRIYSLYDDSTGVIIGAPCKTGSGVGSQLKTTIVKWTDTPRFASDINRSIMHALLTNGDSNPVTWKGCGIFSLNGILFMTVCRQTYGPSQTSTNCSIIKSTDKGQTWISANGINAGPPKDGSAMFTAVQNTAPFFLMYGQDGDPPSQDNADTYVYLYSAANGTSGVWNNGDRLYLARVLRADLVDQTFDASRYTYYAGGDGLQDSSWDRNPEHAIAVLFKAGSVSMTAPFWVPAAKLPGSPTGRYLLPMWYQDSSNPVIHTVWDIYESATPWGPWTQLQTMDWPGYGFYNVAPWQPSLYTSSDTIVLTATGDSSDPFGPLQSKYSPYFVEVKLSGGPVRAVAQIAREGARRGPGDKPRSHPIPASVPANGLYVLYDFSEMIGTTAHDLSGHGRDAVTDGRWFANAGGIGTARGAIDTGITESFAGDITVVFLYRHIMKRNGLRDEPTNFETIISKGEALAFFRPGTTADTFTCRIGGGAVTSNAFKDDEWHLVACRRTGSALDVFVGSTRIASAVTDERPIGSSRLYLGGNNSPWNPLFGWLGHFGLWTRALDDQEIGRLSAYVTGEMEKWGWSVH